MTSTLETQIKAKVRDIPDFPKPGIIFKDITPVVADVALFRSIIENLVARYRPQKVTAILGIESRGFIFGTPLAHQLGVPFHLVRKKGKLPYKTIECTYDLEYGSATIEMHIDALQAGDRVVVMDDLLATGGTAAAACDLAQRQGAQILECAFLIELGFLDGRKKLKDLPIYALAKY